MIKLKWESEWRIVGAVESFVLLLEFVRKWVSLYSRLFCVYVCGFVRVQQYLQHTLLVGQFILLYHLTCFTLQTIDAIWFWFHFHASTCVCALLVMFYFSKWVWHVNVHYTMANVSYHNYCNVWLFLSIIYGNSFILNNK